MAKIYLSIVLLSLLATSCSKKELSLESRSGNQVKALGKGGMGMADLYPMNTYESILKCLNMGADGVELDVQMTSDSVLVAFHDETLAVLGMSGTVNDYTWSELQDARYLGAAYTQYRLVSLNTLFAKLPQRHDYIYSFDCKLFFNAGRVSTEKFLNGFATALSRLIVNYNLKQQILIESYDSGFLTQIKDRHDGYQLYLNSHSFEDALQTATVLQLDGINMVATNISADEIKRAQEQHLLVQVQGTNNRRQNIDAIEKNPDFIQANDIRSLVDLLD